MTEPDLLTWARDHAHRRDPGTSLAAAHRARGFATTHCGIIYRLLRSNRPGLTSRQIAGALTLSYHEVARRMSDLKRAGLVVDSGERRRNPSGLQAAVWRARDG